MDARERTVLYYRTIQQIAPFGDWRNGIGGDAVLAAVDARIARLRGGNFGDSKPIGDGASENRIDFGPGYRIYYGIDGDKIVLLLGGDKSTQDADIKQAKKYWADYKKREKARKEAERKKEVLKNGDGLQKGPHKRSKK